MIARRYNPTISPHFRRNRNISLHGRPVSAPTNAKRYPDKLKIDMDILGTYCRRMASWAIFAQKCATKSALANEGKLGYNKV